MTHTPEHTSPLNEAQSTQLIQNTLGAAQDRLGQMIDGNGMHKSGARISEKHLRLDPMTLTAKISIGFDASEERTSGQNPKGITVQGSDDIATTRDQHITNLCQDPAFQTHLYQILKSQNYALDTVQTIPLKDQSLSVSYFGTCHTCRGERTSTCQACTGQGMQPCQACQGQGRLMCDVCRGTRQIPQQGGTFTSCHECQGFGSRPCHNCNELKTVSCGQCNGQGKTGCQDCHETGEQTHITTFTFKTEMHSQITAEDTDLQSHYQNARQLCDDETLLKDGHIQFDEKNISTDIENNILHWTMHSPTPHGTIDFSLNGKRLSTTVFGQKGLIYTETPFLDHLIKPGISALHKIVKGPMATTALFEQAVQFRLIKTVINRITHQPKKKIFKHIQNTYPIGLSDKYCKALITFADKSLKKVMVKPRWIGSLTGAALGAFLIFSWFHLGIRPEALQDKPINTQIFADAALGAICCVFISILIKIMTQNALKNTLGNTPKKLPAVGDQALAGFGIIILALLASAATSSAPPLWWTQFF